jgi:hypothetical protein
MNSKVVPFPGHCFANLFLHGITKQPVHCIGIQHTDASACPIVHHSQIQTERYGKGGWYMSKLCFQTHAPDMLEMLCCRNVLLLLLLSVTPPYDVLLGSGCVVSRAAEQRTTRLCTGYSIVSTRRHTVRRPHAGLLDRNTQTTIICLFGFISSSLYFAEIFLKGEMHLWWCMNSTVVTVALGPAGKLTSRSLPPQRGYWGLSTRWARCLFLCSSLGFSNGPQG